MDIEWAVIIGAAIVWVSNIVFELIRHKLGLAGRREERWDEFQRGQMTEVQDQAILLVQAGGRAYHEFIRLYDVATPRQQAGVENVVASDTLRDARTRFWDAYFRLDALRERVHDEAIRGAIAATQEAGRRAAVTPPGLARQGLPSLTDDFDAMTDAYERLLKLTGDQLRGESLRSAPDDMWRIPKPSILNRRDSKDAPK